MPPYAHASSPYARFSEDSAIEARTINKAGIDEQEEKLSKMAMLAVALKRQLAGESVKNDAVEAVLREIERGELDSDAALQRLQTPAAADVETFAPGTADDAAAEPTGGEEEENKSAAAPRGAVAQLQYLNALSNQGGVRHACHLRPTYLTTGNPSYTFTQTEDHFGRGYARPMAVERPVMDRRGPAAYNPRWQASSSYGTHPSDRSAFSVTEPRFRGTGGAYPDNPPLTGPISAIGRQAEAMKRTMPYSSHHLLNQGSQRRVVLASKPASTFGGGPRIANRGPPSSTPGPGAYDPCA